MLAMASHIQRIITRTIPNKIQSGTFGSMYFLVTLCFSDVQVCQVILPELILNIMLELIFDEISTLCLNAI